MAVGYSHVRGRPGSIDELPEECRDDVIWALEQLHQRSRTQADILFELNDRLAVKGAGPISKSAFNRRVLRTVAATRRMDETREIYAGLAKVLTPEKVDENSIIIGEFLKTLIFELVEDGTGDKTPKQAMELARAYQAAIAGQKISAERRSKLEAEFNTKADKALATVAKTRGLSGDILQDIRRELFGVRDGA